VVDRVLLSPRYALPSAFTDRRSSMKMKSTLVALLAACTMFACAAEEVPEESTDAPTVVQSKSEDPTEGNDEQASGSAEITPKIAASGWCVTGYHFGRNWSYCCYDDGDCQFWSQ
jgi:hypothetical protein